MAASQSEQISLNGYSTEQWIALAVRTIEKIGWKITAVNQTGVSAHSKTSGWSWGEKIHIAVGNEEATIKSECTGNQAIDWGKNSKNIQLFKQTFEELKLVFSQVQLTRMFDEIIAFRASEEQNEVIDASTEPGRGFLSFFIPGKNYVITPILFYLNVAVFLAMVASGVNAMLPDNESLLKWGANFRPVTVEGEWWRLITCCFIHIGVLHLLFNMYALIYIGVLLEPILGKARFITAYVLTGIVASVCSLWWYDFTLSAGASGAIFGMYGVFLAMLTTNLIEQEERKSLFISIGVFVLYNLSSGINGQVDNAAHIGGLLSGVVIGFMLIPSLQKRTNPLKYGSLAVIALLVFIGSWFVGQSLQNDIGQFEEGIRKFGKYEEKALSMYKLPNTTTDAEYLETIKTEALPNWKKGLELLKELEDLKLPSQIRDRLDLMIRYCVLRIESCEVMKKSIEENNEEYAAEFEEKSKEIENIINELRGNNEQ